MIDYIRVSRSDIAPSKLSHITYDTYLQSNKPSDDVNGDREKLKIQLENDLLSLEPDLYQI